jgi:hypothetical protein
MPLIQTLLSLKADKLADFLTNIKSFKYYPAFLTGGMSIRAFNDDIGFGIEHSGIEFRSLDDFHSIEDQSLKLVFQYLDHFKLMIGDNALFVFMIDPNYTEPNRIIALDNTKISNKEVTCDTMTSSDGFTIIERPVQVQWRVVKGLQIPTVIVADFRIKRQVKLILDWLQAEDEMVQLTNSAILTTNLNQMKKVTKDKRANIRTELESKLEALSTMFLSASEHEISKFKKTTDCPAKILAVSDTMIVEIKDTDQFDAEKEADTEVTLELGTIYKEQIGRIITLFDIGYSKGDITRMINTHYDGDIDAFVKELAKTASPLSLRDKIISVIENTQELIIDVVQDKGQDMTGQERLKSASLLQSLEVALHNISSTTKDREIISALVNMLLPH